MTIAPPPQPFDIQSLLQILCDLRDPVHGCPWDREQTFATIAPYTVEEAYEVTDAIDRGALDELCGELGDLLLQVVYHAQMANEQSAFDFHDVVAGICAKMVHRHPHVYGTEDASGGEPRERRWEELKAAERAASGATSVLDGIALSLPSLKRAEKLQKRAARVGFDWPDATGARAKIDEELQEVDEASTPIEQSQEIGDLLFSVVNWARHLKVDPEEALRGANSRFETRIRHMETNADRGLRELSLDALDQLWNAAKRQLGNQSSSG